MRWFKGRGVEAERLTVDNWRLWSPNNWWVADETVKAWEKERLPPPLFAPGCNRCGQDREDHLLWFGDGSGMSPLCEICWDELETAEARRPFLRALWVRWDMTAKYEGCPYGEHTDGRHPFQRGHTHTSWERIELALAQEAEGSSVT